MITKPATTPPLVMTQDRFALQVVSVLDRQVAALPADITERLRFARQLAVEKARTSRLVMASAPAALENGGHTAVSGKFGGWGWRVASLLPFAVLVLGLVSIDSWQKSSQIDAAAEVDAALLSDTLPPSAYSDPGFVEFLKQRDR